jgi:hypothetical protein
MLVVMYIRLVSKTGRTNSLVVNFEGVDYTFDKDGQSDLFLHAPDHIGNVLFSLM